MKITCQACQSKYTIADDKIQGKVAKIRCRKCGATVLVDASAGGGATNGSASTGAGDPWMVSVAEGDQRNMTMREVIDAYNTGIITGDTFVWKDGMGDWQPLSEVSEIVEALNVANEEATAAAAQDFSEPVQDYNPPAAFSPPAPVAARRETGRGGRSDLFGSPSTEEEVATSAPVQVTPRGPAAAARSAGSAAATPAQPSAGSGLTGERNEQSVLFSLSALTSNAKAPAAPSPVTSSSSNSGSAKADDSGVIDLGALAKAQAAKPVEAAVSPLAAPSPFLFPAALGTVETFQPQEQKKKSSMPLIIGGGVAIVVIAAAAFMLTGKKEEIPSLPAGAALSAAAPTAAPTPEPSAAPAPTAEASAAPADSATAKAPAKKAGGGGVARPKPAGGTAAAAAPATPLPPPKPKSPCGCAPGDLQCSIRCSATGH
jgi:predicted Zn finger-like uncharacterized protein